MALWSTDPSKQGPLLKEFVRRGILRRDSDVSTKGGIKRESEEYQRGNQQKSGENIQRSILSYMKACTRRTKVRAAL